MHARFGRAEALLMLASIPLRVECRSGYKAEEHPHAVYLEDKRLAVIEILKHDPAGSVWFLICEL